MKPAGWLLPLAALGCTDPAPAPAAPAPPVSAPAAPATPTATPTPAPAPTAPPAGWTVAVYMAADNDLEGEALSDVEEMLTASHPGLRFVVQLDRAGKSPFSLHKVAPWAGAQRFVIADRKLAPAGLLGPVDTGEAPALADFTAFAAQQAGADRLAIVLWGHGHGALGLADDATSGHRLSPQALGEALLGGLAAAGASRAEFLGFDACSMADLGVASQVAPAARWMFASQHRTPGSGWSYRALLDFARPQRDSAADLADLLAQEALGASSAFDAPPAWSLLDLDRVGPPRDALALLADQAPPGDALCAALPAPGAPGADESMEDIYTLAPRLAALPGLAAPGDELREAAAACVARRWGWPGKTAGVGLSVLARLGAGEPVPGDALAGWWQRLQGCDGAP